MKRKNKTLSSGSREDFVSMVLGLVIVGVVIGLIFNFIQKRRGSISVPGISNQISLTDDLTLNPTGKEEKTGVYVVKKGDNLWDISMNIYGNGYKWVEIAKENNLANANYLMVGQKLNLLPTKVSSGSSGEYVVKKGDSLWKISVNLYGDGFRWVEIWNQNKGLIINPNVIRIGTRLALP